MNRFLSIWFRQLLTDEATQRQPALKTASFVMARAERGRSIIQAANAIAAAEGIRPGMAVADARAVCPSLIVAAHRNGREKELLKTLAKKCLRYTPDVAIDSPDGLILNITGCPHLWGGERRYLKDLITTLNHEGYDARAAIADTIGAAWAIARYGTVSPIIVPGRQKEALASLPPEALRLPPPITEQFYKLGLYTIDSLINLPRTSLRRRFGIEILNRIDQALGNTPEYIQPIRFPPAYEERLSCLEPICTAKGIKIAIHKLLKELCLRLSREEKGLRTAILTCHRTDNKKQQISICTRHPSRNITHLLKLFELKIPMLQPAAGIELFLLEATLTEVITTTQEALWDTGKDEQTVTELLDKIAAKIGINKIHRYLPQEHYWPERSYKEAATPREKPATAWRADQRRPIRLLPQPEEISVSVPLPDYPPLLFRHKGNLHRIIKADGPERIEPEWWLEDGRHRDYYVVEEESGARYWLFRSGHFKEQQATWYLHGFFA